MPTKKKPTQLDRIESKLDTILSGAAFMQELDKNARQLQDMKEIGEKWDAEEQGLKAGDYTDASKETADALTAMGFKWEDGDRVGLDFIVFTSAKGILNTDIVDSTHLTPATFLSRAAVTAKEIGLVPVEPWVPKVGDYFVVVKNSDPEGWPQWNHMGRMDGLIGSVRRVEEFQPENRRGTKTVGCGEWDWKVSDLRPATDAEIAAHLAEQEAKKPVVFGTRVNHATRGQGIWMGMNGILHELAFLEHGKDHQHQWSTYLCGRMMFTVID